MGAEADAHHRQVRGVRRFDEVELGLHPVVLGEFIRVLRAAHADNAVDVVEVGGHGLAAVELDDAQLVAVLVEDRAESAGGF